MDAKSIAANVKGYRSDKRFTQKGLAELAGVSLPTIKQIERGQENPSMKTLLLVAKALKVRLQDLTQTPEPLPCVRFRAMKKLKNRSVVLSATSRWLKDYEFLEQELSCQRDFTLKGVEYQGSPETFANEIRQAIGLRPDEQIPDIGLLLDELGVKLLLYNKTQSDGFFGLSLFDKNKNPAIVVNTSDIFTPERQIFSAAHELGHVLMHAQSFGQDTELEESKQEEDEANTFAGYFLMPNSGFEKLWKRTDGHLLVDRVLYVRSYFRVSYQTVLYRLNQLTGQNLIPLFNYRYEMMYGTKLNKKAEPNGLNWKFEENRFSSLVCQALRAEKISISRAAEMLNVSMSQMLQIINSIPDKE